MASVLYDQLADELDEMEKRYSTLLQEFRKTGDDEIFIDLDADLIILSDKANFLTNLEERYEINRRVTILQRLIRSLSHSAY